MFGLFSAILNRTSQQQKLSWDRKVQRKTWEREDNAVQRRATDLQAAGFSRTLAAGQGANAGAVVPTEAPQLNAPDPIETVMNLIQQGKNIAKTDAETKMIKMQTKKAGVDTARESRDLMLNKRHGLRSNNKSVFGNIFQDMEDYYQKMQDKAKKWMNIKPQKRR